MVAHSFFGGNLCRTLAALGQLVFLAFSGSLPVECSNPACLSLGGQSSIPSGSIAQGGAALSCPPHTEKPSTPCAQAGTPKCWPRPHVKFLAGGMVIIYLSLIAEQKRKRPVLAVCTSREVSETIALTTRIVSRGDGGRFFDPEGGSEAAAAKHREEAQDCRADDAA